ncbi:MAG: integrase core domain-containing protein [Nitrococcus mobilis]|nr:integrase core domain-containing protein [Nitrococcus mobilis]
MSRKGNCWDNAVMERFFGSLKSEWTDGQRYMTRTQARQDVIEYIEMHYNWDRLHSTLDYLTPREKERAAAASMGVRSELTRTCWKPTTLGTANRRTRRGQACSPGRLRQGAHKPIATPARLPAVARDL